MKVFLKLFFWNSLCVSFLCALSFFMFFSLSFFFFPISIFMYFLWCVFELVDFSFFLWSLFKFAFSYILQLLKLVHLNYLLNFIYLFIYYLFIIFIVCVLGYLVCMSLFYFFFCSFIFFDLIVMQRCPTKIIPVFFCYCIVSFFFFFKFFPCTIFFSLIASLGLFQIYIMFFIFMDDYEVWFVLSFFFNCYNFFVKLNSHLLSWMLKVDL